MAVRLLGLVVLLNAVLIILPIPLGNTLPAMAVMSVALGLIARDGMAVAAGLGLSVCALAASAALVGAQRKVLVYVSYSDRIFTGSPKNSISSVPLMLWDGVAPRTM